MGILLADVALRLIGFSKSPSGMVESLILNRREVTETRSRSFSDRGGVLSVRMRPRVDARMQTRRVHSSSIMRRKERVRDIERLERRERSSLSLRLAMFESSAAKNPPFLCFCPSFCCPERGRRCPSASPSFDGNIFLTQ